MKKIFRFLSICALAVNMASCDYLDIVPDERAKESDTWANPTAIKKYLTPAMATCLITERIQVLIGCLKR